MAAKDIAGNCLAGNSLIPVHERRDTHASDKDGSGVATAAVRPSTIDPFGKVHGAANGITLSPDASSIGGCVRSSTAPTTEGTAPILVNCASAVARDYTGLKTCADLGGTKLLTLLATGVVLASQPALSQGAMGPGGPTMAPQPRMAPTPQAPRGPAVIPGASAMAPSPSMTNGTPQGLPTADSGGKGAAPADIYGHNTTNGSSGNAPAVAPAPSVNRLQPRPLIGNGGNGGILIGNGGNGIKGTEPVIIYNGTITSEPTNQLKQEPSRAPLPAGYAYDSTGRIVYVGR